MRYAKGVCWIGDCRIPYINEIPNIGGRANHGRGDGYGFVAMRDEIKPNMDGRFTPNLLVCDDMLNDGVITKQSKRTYKPTEHTGSLFGNSPQAHGVGIGDSGSSSRYYDLDKWFDKIIKEL